MTGRHRLITRHAQFRPNRQTVDYAIQSQGRNAKRLDITTENTPMPDTPISIRAVQENISTRLFRIMSYLKQTDTAKSIDGYTLMDDNKRFVPAVQQRLEKQLSLDPAKPSYQQFIDSLAIDFYQWLAFSKERKHEIGAIIEPDIGVFITYTRQPR